MVCVWCPRTKKSVTTIFVYLQALTQCFSAHMKINIQITSFLPTVHVFAFYFVLDFSLIQITHRLSLVTSSHITLFAHNIHITIFKPSIHITLHCPHTASYTVTKQKKRNKENSFRQPKK